MKYLPLLSLPMLWLTMNLPTVCADDSGPAEPEVAADDADDELDLAVQMTLQAYRDELDALRCMQDAASTVASAERLRRAIGLRYKLYCMSFDYGHYKERCAEEMPRVEHACEVELKRLMKSDFYGVMPVRAIFCSDRSTLSSTGETLRCAELLSVDEIKAMLESKKDLMEQYCAQNAWVEGGPGFTRDLAWVIKAEADVIPRERHLLRTLWQRGCCGQSLHHVDGRYYDCLYILFTRDGEPCRMEQWFDITAYWKAHGAEYGSGK